MINLHHILAQQPAGLIFDIDGTLSPIAPTPGEARLHRDAASLLAEAAQYARVAILTGRGLESGAAMVNVEGLTYIGSHGTEWSVGLPTTHEIQLAPEALPFAEPARQLLDQAEQAFSQIPGILIERKRVGGVIHYRLVADPEQTRQLILDTLHESAEQYHMRLSEGKKIIEIRPTVASNKGLALRRFVQQSGCKGVIFAGDDRTDLDAILEVKRLQQEGIAAASIAVQHTDTPPELFEHADITVQEVEGMIQLLAELVAFLRTDSYKEGLSI